MSQRKIKHIGEDQGLVIVDVDKLSDLQPTDILVFSVSPPSYVDQPHIFHVNIKEMLAKNGMKNRYIVLAPNMMLNVLRLEP
jgi:hypothetical protein